MASINSFPFTTESRCLLHNSNGYYRKIPLDVGGFLKFTDYNGNYSYWKSSTLSPSLWCVKSLDVCKRGNLLRSSRLKAIANDSNEGEKDNKESEDAIQATIEKSNKVLAMQKELLQQIAERKKLVSSIKNSMSNKNVEGFTEDSNSTSPKVDLGTNQNDVNNEYNGSIVSERSIDSVYSKNSKEQSSVPVYVREGRRERIKSPLKSVNSDSSKQQEVLNWVPEKTPSKPYEKLKLRGNFSNLVS